jgi:hypothetical protein
MTLHFPNASRNYNPTQHCVCFWGHDSAFEISFHLDEEALCKVSPYFYCVINAIGLQVVGALTDSMDIARGISRARR